MELYRTTFRIMLNDAIKHREEIEKHRWGYTQDSAHLATIKEMFAKTESEDSTIYLKDDDV